MSDKVQDEEGKKNTLFLFFISIAVSQQHMTVSVKVTAAGEDRQDCLSGLRASARCSKFPALISCRLCLLGEDDDLLAPFHGGWILF